MEPMDKPLGMRRATLAVEVRTEVERMIIDGELAAGEKLNELVLSQALGVSRGTVREAIRSLADSGLIDLVANRGAFVHQTTLQEISNLYDLRGAIFGMACAAAAHQVVAGNAPELVAAMRENLADMRAAHGADDIQRYYALNIAFHDMLMNAAANPKAKTIYDNLVKEMHLFRRRGLSLASNIARSIVEHAAIADAVSAGDPEAARAAAEAHIMSALGRYMDIAENAPADLPRRA